MRIPHDCGCYSHTACHTEQSDFKCARCDAGSKAASLKRPYEEVNNYPDFDWVTANGKDINARVASAQATIKKWLNLGATHVGQTENPLVFLRSKESLETLFKRRKWSLADLYFRGATLGKT